MPRVELVEIGPRIDFVVDRKKLASEDLFRTALRRPKQLLVRAGFRLGSFQPEGDSQGVSFLDQNAKEHQSRRVRDKARADPCGQTESGHYPNQKGQGASSKSPPVRGEQLKRRRCDGCYCLRYV